MSPAKKWEGPSMHRTQFHYTGQKIEKGNREGMPYLMCLLPTQT